MKTSNEPIKTAINEPHSAEWFTITYGTTKEKAGREMQVMCDNKTIEAVATAISIAISKEHNQHNKSESSWCYYTNSKGKQTIVSGCI